LDVGETDNKMKKINFKKIKNGGFTLQNPAKLDLRGFTLVEMLVAIFVFITVLGASSAIFVDVIRNQKRVLANQELLNQTSYVLEYMGRAIRMAKKDDIGGAVNCLTCPACNYEATHCVGVVCHGIKFRDYKDEYCQEFFREQVAPGIYRLKELKVKISDGTTILNDLTSADLNVEFFNIGPSDSWDQGDLDQPRVTLFLDIKRSDFPSGEAPEVKIQTTISQRNLDVPY
jgi:Tfp pilus assembly protein PilE